MSTTQPGAPESTDPAIRVLVRAFAPLDKRALGLAIGATAGLVVFLLTAFHLLVREPEGFGLWLLAQYFYGYRISWPGAFVGFWWAFVAGFAAGWFFAFVRNLVVATWIFVVRARASLSQNQDFLDHI